LAVILFEELCRICIEQGCWHHSITNSSYV